MQLTVVGAGNGGLAVAAYAGLTSWDVRLYDVREEAVRAVAEKGGIQVDGVLSGIAPVTVSTVDPEEALAGSDLVVFVVPGTAQGAAARTVASHVGSEQLVLVTPGCTGGALEVAATLAAAGKPGVVVAETDTFAFGCSTPAFAESRITSVKQRIGIGVVPRSRRFAAIELIQKLFPQARDAHSVIHTGLANMNAVLHVAPMVVNAGWIEAERESFDFYGAGISVSVARLIEEFDAERLRVAAALGVESNSLRQWIKEVYGVEASTTYDTIRLLSRDVYKASPAPTTLLHRYLTEDVPCGAVPVASLAGAVGVDVPLHRSLIYVASLLCEQDFWHTGRTLDRLGIPDATAASLRQLAGL